MIGEIISIGDELLSGTVINSNAACIGQSLIETNCDVRWVTAIGDDEGDILTAFKLAGSRASLVVATGGLGPTPDDKTKSVTARFLDSKLVFEPSILRRLEEQFSKRGLELPQVNKAQAEIPEKAELIPNPVGSAPGFSFKWQDAHFFILPGVPSEMKAMMEQTVLPFVQKTVPDFIRTRVLRTTGIAESKLYNDIIDFETRYPHVRLAFLPQRQGVQLRMTTRGSSQEECDDVLERGAEYIRSKVGQSIYGEGDTTLEAVVAELLVRKGLTIAVAESCTGGLVSHKLTNIPGSSAYFDRGIVAYQDSVKINVLGVDENVIHQYGAVSQETAQAMAEGVRRISGTDIGISTTGIAGPGGARPNKPVGLVWIGYSDNHSVFSESHRFTKSRLWNKERFANAVMDMTRRALLDEQRNPL
jgi:nicotinamide-nucleotide amidase